MTCALVHLIAVGTCGIIVAAACWCVVLKLLVVPAFHV